MSQISRKRPPIKPLLKFDQSMYEPSEDAMLMRKKRIIIQHLSFESFYLRYQDLDQYYNSKLFSKYIRRQKALRTFDFPTSFLQKRYGSVRENLKGFKNLRKFQYDFYSRSNTTLKTFNQTLRNLPLLKEVSLIPSEPQDRIDDSLIREATSVLKSFPFLRTIHIDLTKCYKITNTGLAKVTFSIRRLKNLQTFRLDMSDGAQISNLDFKSSSSSLNNFPSLQNIVLDLSYAMWAAKDKSDTICRGLEQLKTLKTFTLNASECPSIHANVLPILAKQLAGLSCLESLDLNFVNCQNLLHPHQKLTSKNLKSLASCIADRKNLKKLDVAFSSLDNTDDNFQQFHYSLRNLSSLEYLHLSFIYCGITNENFQSLGESLQCIDGLKVLDLHLIEPYFSDKAFVFISQGIKCHLHLQHLKLDFLTSNITCIGNIGLTNLGEALDSIESLQSFLLYFGSYCEVDEGIGNLSKALIRHKEIRNLEIFLQSTSKWTDKGFQALIQNLRSLESLRRLTLKFTNCCEITDNGFADLGRVLLGLKAVKKVNVLFKNCKKVTKIKVVKVNDMLNRHTSLRRYSVAAE